MISNNRITGSCSNRIFFNKIPLRLINVAALIFAIWNPLRAQDYKNVYFNSSWIVTSIDSATYYRMSGFNSSLPSYDGEISDYYIKNNQLEMIGSYHNGLKDGEFKFYFANGKVRLIASFSNNARVGIWEEFYQNGIIKTKLSYNEDSERLLELNDSLGNSVLKEGNFKCHLYYYDFLDNQSNKKEELGISGKVRQTFRDGKWTVRKNGQSYASMVFKTGVLEKGYYLQDNQRVPLNSNLVFPLIADPVKFYPTENFVLQEGAEIKNNYVMDGLHQYKFKKKIVIKSYEDIVKYVNDNFDLRSKKKATVISIRITTINGFISGFTTDPKISDQGTENLKLVLDSVEKLDFMKDDAITILYTINFEEKFGKN